MSVRRSPHHQACDLNGNIDTHNTSHINAKAMKQFIKNIPIVGDTLASVYRRWQGGSAFRNSQDYWQLRYERGDNSGAGSYGRLAGFKAAVINGVVSANDLTSVIEYGCGDGNQLTLARYPSYVGFDVSTKAVELCRSKFAGDDSKRFALIEDYSGETADLTLTLDVIYHLVEDDVYDTYMKRLFDTAKRCVIVYSSNHDESALPTFPHVRHRRFADWVASHRGDWALAAHVPNRFPQVTNNTKDESFADFFIYAKRDADRPIVVSH